MGQSGPESGDNKGVLYISQSSSITGSSPSDVWVSYTGYSLEVLHRVLVPYPGHLLVGLLPLCREAVGVFYLPSRLGHRAVWFHLTNNIHSNYPWLNSSIWPIDRTLLGATIPVQSEPGSKSNKGVLCISQSSSITGASQSDVWVSYTEYSLEVLHLCKSTIGIFYISIPFNTRIMQ